MNRENPPLRVLFEAMVDNVMAPLNVADELTRRALEIAKAEKKDRK